MNTVGSKKRKEGDTEANRIVIGQAESEARIEAGVLTNTMLVIFINCALYPCFTSIKRPLHK